MTKDDDCVTSVLDLIVQTLEAQRITMTVIMWLFLLSWLLNVLTMACVVVFR